MEEDKRLTPEDTQEEQVDVEKQEEEVEVPETDVEQQEGTETETVKIGDDEYDADQLTDLLAKAGKYDDLLPDYTRKTQELSEYKKTLGDKKEVQQPIITDEEVAIDTDTEKILNQWAKKKGLVPLEEIQRTTYEQEKDSQVKEFIKGFPEYNLENDPNNLRWNQLIGEVNSFYKMPANPKDVKTLLEKVHNSLRAPSELEKAENKTLAKIQKAKTATLGGEGKGSTGTPAAKRQFTTEQIDAYRRGGWSEEDIKELMG